MPIDAVQAGQEVRLKMVSTSIDATLVERVRRGDYVVDAEAVAEAMLRRWRAAGSAVLVPVQPLDGPPVEADEDEAPAGADLA
jgi:hypothetical protein